MDELKIKNVKNVVYWLENVIFAGKNQKTNFYLLAY